MVLEVDQITTIFLAVLVYMIGLFLNSKIRMLHKFCIPAPVVGGLIFAVIATTLKGMNVLDITLDTSLQGIFMLTFFTTIGLGASFRLVKLGGKLLVIYWLACGFLALAQTAIGVSFAKLLNIEPLIGIMVGAVSMEGGHGAATAFGTTIEGMGYDSALSIGLAAATVGLVAGGLIGGPIVKHLIDKYNLKPSELEGESQSVSSIQHESNQINSNTFMIQILIITFCMTVGTVLGNLFTETTGFALPGYVGAMFVAVIVRNLIDKYDDKVIEMKSIGVISDITLGVFLSMALMNIQLWEIADLALPLLLIIIVQVVFIVLFGIFVLFKLLGKDYDAAVMVAGFAGHGLGATPNAIANMDAIVSRFGPSQRAFLIVPIVGAFLIDVFAMPIIITSINLFS